MKAQIAMELLIYTTLLLVFFGLMAYSSISLQTEADNMRVYSEARKILESVASEINLAAKVGDGYRRKFFVQPTIAGADFNLTVKNYFLILTSPRLSLIMPLVVKEIEGEISKGFNFIKNVEGVIYVKSSNP